MKSLEYYKQLSEELAAELETAQRELEAMRNQKPVMSQFKCGNGWGNFMDDRHEKNTREAGYIIRDLYAKPVYQHSFTQAGVGTVYGDQDMITQIERKFGIKAHLTLVE